ncbi:unnamed protein product [Schistosoma intercalatum]|nr:unnamed protein product [Schistosoma intercalatum]
MHDRAPSARTWALNTCGALCLGLFQINSVLFTSCSVMEKKTSMKLLTSGAGLRLYVLRKLIFFCNIS